MTAQLTEFTVVQLSEDVETNQSTTGGNLPTIVRFSGTLTFTPSHPEIESAPLDTTVIINPIVGRWDGSDGVLKSINGTPGVGLIDNQYLGLAPGELTYRVDYSNLVWDDESGRAMRSFRFAAPGDGSTVDLTTVTRLPL